VSNEARQQKRDEIMKLEILERRNAIVEKARLKKWTDRDSTKALTRAVHKMEVWSIFCYRLVVLIALYSIICTA